MRRSCPVDSFTPSLYIKALRFFGFFLLNLLFLTFPAVGQQSPPAVLSDDFYVLDKTSFVDTWRNDQGWDGHAWRVVINGMHGSASVPCTPSPDLSPLCVEFSPSGGYTGFDFYTYKDVACCGNPPGPDSNIAVVYLLLIGNNDDSTNAGPYWCGSVGGPINVTNGNVWFEQRDYNLPGLGEIINVNRFYNSIIQTPGLFGFGWSTKYDESLIIYSSQMIRLNLPNGRATYFGRKQTTDPYFFSFSPDAVGKIFPNQDGTYTLVYKDGSTRKFSSTGRLLSSGDRNGNLTTLTYDIDGRLTAVTDVVGRTLAFTPNTNGTISQISDSIGVVASYQYDTANPFLLKMVTYPDGSQYKFDYTNIVVNGFTKTFLTTVKDALDNILETHQYDSQGRAITSEKQGGAEHYSLTYDQSDFTYGLYTKVTDARGNVTKYFYYPDYYTKKVVFRTEGVCSCGGSSSEITQYTYDDRLNVETKTDALNHKTTYTYDDDRNVLTETESDITSGQQIGLRKWTYNSLGEVLTYKDRADSQNPDPNVNTQVNTYDANGNLLTSKDALNNTTTLTYTGLGQLQTIKDALNHTTTLSYDSQGHLTQVTDANNKTTNIAYDARVRPISVTNALSETTGFEYDLNNRLKKIIYPDTNFITYTYDLAGRRTGMTDARGNPTTYAYDGAYRLTSITDALNHSTTFGYDLMSNLTSQTDALSNTTSYQYDDFNRLKTIIYPAASTGTTPLQESVTYDRLGNVKTRVDTGGRTTTYDYDTLNRLTKITDALNQITQFEYNLRSQMTKVTDAKNQQYTFTYDPLGRELSQTRAGSTMSFVYDAVGNRTGRTDYMGRVTNYEYDNLNRLKKIVYGTPVTNGGPPNPQSTFSYDDLSRLLTAVNEAGTVSFTYDNRGREKTETDVFGHVLTYNYDQNGNRTELKIDGTTNTTYAYDVANRLTTLTDEASQNFGFGYDNANKLFSKTLPNGITSTYDYDGMSRLKELKHQGTSTITDNLYSYNGANQISQIAELAQTKVFTYDNIDRLTGMTSGASSESYAFDGVGNRTASHRSSSYSYQPFNKLTATQMGNYTYDSNGSMVSKYDGTYWRYGWDFENRMVTASTRKQSVRYKYDALGRRVQRVFGYGKEFTKFTYDGLDIVMDDDSVSGITKYQNGLGIDNKLKLTNSGVAKYFIQDHLGSTVAFTSPSGAVTEQTSYDSFGNPTNSGFSNRYQYTGREFDSFTGLTFYRARWYDSGLGRFISEDPIGFEGKDINLFSYVYNNPLNYFDPRGTQIRSAERWQPGEVERARELQRAVQSMRSPAFNSRPDMCGPAGRPFISWLVPDSFGGPWGPFGDKNDIHVPCENHDNCVATCGKTIEQCGLELKKDIEDICDQAGGQYLEQCRNYVDKYYKGVTDYYTKRVGIPWYPGQEAYDSAQEDSACIACKGKPYPLPPDPCSKYGDWRCK